MNYLWGAMLLIGIVYGALTGNLEAVTQQALDSAKEAVALCISMAGVMAFWVGLMQIAESMGLVRQMAKGISPLLTFLFPEIPKEHPARNYIATNMIANFFGLGWAATPAGLKAMEALEDLEEERRSVQKQGSDGYVPYGSPGLGVPAGKEKRGSTSKGNPYKRITAQPKGTASNEMCTFLVLNISSLQLIPVNIIAYRSQYGSVNPTAIVGPAILATAVSTGAAVVFCKVMDTRKRRG